MVHFWVWEKGGEGGGVGKKGGRGGGVGKKG